MYVKGPEKETIEKLMREAAEALPVSGETELQVVVRPKTDCMKSALDIQPLIYRLKILSNLSVVKFPQCRPVSP